MFVMTVYGVLLPLYSFESFLRTTTCSMKPGRSDTTIRFDQIVHRSSRAILNYPTEADDDPGIGDQWDPFTPIRSLNSRLSTNRVKVLKSTNMLGQAQVIDLLPYSTLRPRILQSGLKLTDDPW